MKCVNLEPICEQIFLRQTMKGTNMYLYVVYIYEVVLSLWLRTYLQMIEV